MKTKFTQKFNGDSVSVTSSDMNFLAMADYISQTSSATLETARLLDAKIATEFGKDTKSGMVELWGGYLAAVKAEAIVRRASAQKRLDQLTKQAEEAQKSVSSPFANTTIAHAIFAYQEEGRMRGRKTRERQATLAPGYASCEATSGPPTRLRVYTAPLPHTRESRCPWRSSTLGPSCAVGSVLPSSRRSTEESGTA